jgi:hypothetical protein
MKIVVLYHPQSEFARSVEEYAHDFSRNRGKSIELLSLETQEGAAMATLYDIVRYPAVLALKDDGQLLKNWEGEQLPLMNEVAAYLEV